ncbi:MAG: methyl-accepting chemotaxis protein [Verrucomicrobiota bacterium]
MKLRLRHKVAGLAIFSALLPVLGLAILIAVQERQSSKVIDKEIDEIIGENLDHSVEDIYSLCNVANVLTQKQVNKTLSVADYVLKNQGGINFGEESVVWSARNQYDPDDSRSVALPEMIVGDTVIRPNKTFTTRSPVVDQVKDLVGGTCTIFQRINEEGDMLRVATNVEGHDGFRAVGTFIPAMNNDGLPNPVIKRVVKEREVFEGRAFVVNRWYLTSYRPIFNERGYVVGMLYVGVRQEATPALRTAISEIEMGDNGYVWVMFGLDNNRAGDFVLTSGQFPHSEDIETTRDLNGDTFFDTIRKRAIGLEPGIVEDDTFFWQDFQGVEHQLNIHFTYFAPWDWVIGVTAFQEDFAEPHRQIRQVFNEILFWTLVGAFGLLVVIFVVATWLGAWIASPITYLTEIAGYVARGELAEAQASIRERCNTQSKLRDLSLAQDETGELFRAIQDMIGNLEQLVSEMKGASNQLTESAQEISGTAKLQTGTAQDFGSSSTQIAAAVKEISTTSLELSNTMKNVSKGAHQTTTLAGEGRSHLDTMRDDVEDLSVATKSVSGKLSIIAEKAQNINNVVTTIAKVADQTNLLSLNAAIEAEKAGEFGLGFAVVAREIRRLADQTAVATLDIEQMVKEMQSSVSAGVMEMDKFNEAVRSSVDSVGRLSSQMENIISEVESLTPRFEAVKEGMDAQASGASQISEAVESLNTAAIQTKAALDGFQNAASKLNLAVDAVNGGIALFKTIEDDDASDQKPSPESP